MPSAPVASFPYNEATQNGRGKSGGSEELKSVTDSESAEVGAGGVGGSVKGSVAGSSVSSELSEAGAGVGGSVNGSVAGSSVSSELSVSYRRARRKAMKPGCKSNSIGSGHGKGREQPGSINWDRLCGMVFANICTIPAPIRPSSVDPIELHPFRFLGKLRLSLH
jgi:hypothetical protein